jgi:hypothetical protein
MAIIPVILLAGQKLSGKTTVAKYLLSKIPNSIELTFASRLKNACKTIFNLSDKQLEDQEEKKTIDLRWNITPREMFQVTGDLLRDYLPKLSPNLKITYGSLLTSGIADDIKNLEKSNNPPSLIILSDGRLPDEFNFVKSLKNNVTIRIERSCLKNNDNHKTEQVNFITDLVIKNDGNLTELYEQLDHFISKFKENGFL